MSVLAGLAFGAGAQFVNNVLASHAADESYAKQKALMDKQNEMNRANVYGQTQLQAQGARMAGFNPAMFMNGGTQPAPTVSQGNADMAQTFPLDVSDMLALAQINKTQAETENVKADTNVKKNQAPNVAADTSLKLAQKLYTDAGTEVQNQKAQEISNINEQYADRNNTVKATGPAMMDQWRSGLQEKGLWDKLLPKTRETIDAIADGEFDLSVGGLAALKDIVGTQTDISDADRKVVENGLRSAVIYGQLSEPAVLNAMSKMPWYEAELKRVGKDKILADIDKVRKEIEKIGNRAYTDEKGVKHEAKGELAILELEKKYKEMLNKSFQSGDLDYLKSQGEYGKWFEKYSEDLLQNILPNILPTALLNRGLYNAGKGARSKPKSSTGDGDFVPRQMPDGSIEIRTKDQWKQYDSNISDFNFGR